MPNTTLIVGAAIVIALIIAAEILIHWNKG